MAKVIFNEGQLAKKLADTGWMSTLKIAFSTKPCSGAGQHVATDTRAGGYGEITGSGWYTPGGVTVSEPAAAADGTKTWPTASVATGANTNGPSAVKSAVVIDPADNTLLAAIDLNAVRDLSQTDTVLNYVLTSTQIVN